MGQLGYSPLSSDSRVEILRLLQQRRARTVAEIHDATGLHSNTVREHLQRLMDGGYVVSEIEQRTRRGRPRVFYSVTSDPEAPASEVAKQRATEAAHRGDLMRRVIPATAAESAHLPSQAVHQVDALIEDLIDTGHEPSLHADGDELVLDLSPCERASGGDGAMPDICGVHLNLMQGVLRQAGGPLRVIGMKLDCNPGECLIHLSRG